MVSLSLGKRKDAVNVAKEAEFLQLRELRQVIPVPLTQRRLEMELPKKTAAQILRAFR
jgi:hypothetical protein